MGDNKPEPLNNPYEVDFSDQKSDAAKVKISWYAAPEAGFVIRSTKSGRELSKYMYWLGAGYGTIFDITSAPLLASKVTINSPGQTVEKRKTVHLSATRFPDNAEQPTYTWTTSDNSVAMVDTDGIVYGRSTGTAIITVTAVTADSTILTDTCRVFVVNATDSIADDEKIWTEVTDSNIESLKDGAIIKIYAYGKDGVEDFAISASPQRNEFRLSTSYFSGKEVNGR